MTYWRIFKLILIVLLLFLAVVLYVNHQIVHQAYPITDAKISRTKDPETRQWLIELRNERNQADRTYKTMLKVAMAVDAILLFAVGASLLRHGKSKRLHTNNTASIR